MSDANFSTEMNSTINLMGWNVRAGGFHAYDPALTTPERGEALRVCIEEQHASGVDTVCLCDAYRWDEVYGDDAGIARHLGYASARFVRLNDARLNENNGEGVGIALATERGIQQTKELDLATRKGLGVVLDIGRYGLQVAVVYLDDLRESTRLEQVRALPAALEKNVPTIVIGDFNALRPSVHDVGPSVRAGDIATRALARLLPKRTLLGRTVAEINQREVVPLIESFGFIDADGRRKRPTAPAFLPILGIDLAFHTPDVQIDDFRVLPIRRASDHRPLALRATVLDKQGGSD